MNMAQYGKYQLEGLHNQRICARPSKREKKALKYYIGNEKTLSCLRKKKVLLKKLLMGGGKEREEEEIHVS